MEFTGERFTTEVHGDIELEHLHRYLLACKVAAGKFVLDIASGEGYGSKMLAQTAHKVTGVDISQEAVSHAQEKYQASNLEFRLGSCSGIPLDDASVDVVVSFETIEHHDEHEAMMQEIKRVLRPDGVLVISSPDKLEFSARFGSTNAYHVKELYRDEFVKLLASHFKNLSIYGQRVVYGSAIFREDGISPVESYELSSEELPAIPGVPHAIYLLAIATDAEPPLLSSGVLEQRIEDSDFTKFWRKLMVERDGQIASLNQAVAECDGQIASLNQAVAERDGQIASLHRQIHEILSSKSWKLTKPLRHFRRVLSEQNAVSWRSQASTVVRSAWRALPLSIQRKQRLKSALFTTAPFLFRHTGAYQNWRSFRHSMVHDEQGRLEMESDQSAKQYVSLLDAAPLEGKPARLICFYLPQFHAIPENDEWWGEGFTEWTNVQPARPQFVGHYQPHVPGELGYYNLLDPAVQRRQVELAKLYGIGGFCFYFYWFGGKRLLETPTERYLNDVSLDLPFCLCWANENWSRRWDGQDSQILMAQQYSAEDDLAFIAYVTRYMRDPRYIRVGGRPLLLVYRPGLLPSAQETAVRWRQWCRDNDVGEIYLAYTQSFETVDPAAYGFDAAIEFPPNNSAPPSVTGGVTPLGDDFDCTVYDWQAFVGRSKGYFQPGYKLFRGVCPSWDNTARRKNRGTVFVNNTPTLYQHWLENAIADTVKHHPRADERLIFVNAWNEWAEGTHLEPDARYGYAWLQATRNALSGETYVPDTKRRIVLVAHDAYPHGAQMLVANLAKTLSEGMGFHVDLVCLGDGPLVSEYAKWSAVHLLAGKEPHGSEAKALARRLYESGHRSALVNTTVSGLFLETLVEHGVECVALIHELRGVIDQNRLHRHVRAIAAHARKVVFPAEEVAHSFDDVAAIAPDKLVIRPQGLYKRRDKFRVGESDHMALRQKLGLPEDAEIVLGVGYADHRKGVDLFVAAGLAMATRLPKARWVWIGHWEQTMQHAVEKQLAAAPGLKDRFIFPGLQEDTDLFYGGADVFALPSREDPFPSVVLEAMDAGLPVVGFENAGGFIGLLREGCGRLVEHENVIAFGAAVAAFLEQPEVRCDAGERGAELIVRPFLVSPLRVRPPRSARTRVGQDLGGRAQLQLRALSTGAPAQHLRPGLSDLRNPLPRRSVEGREPRNRARDPFRTGHRLPDRPERRKLGLGIQAMEEGCSTSSAAATSGSPRPTIHVAKISLARRAKASAPLGWCLAIARAGRSMDTGRFWQTAIWPT